MFPSHFESSFLSILQVTSILKISKILYAFEFNNQKKYCRYIKFYKTRVEIRLWYNNDPMMVRVKREIVISHDFFSNSSWC